MTIYNDVVIQKTSVFVKEKLEYEFSGHDWWHIYRVHKLAKYIASKEGAELLVVETAALLHDISDWKSNGGNMSKGGMIAFEWLQSLHVDYNTCTHVQDIIDSTSFKGAKVQDKVHSLEGRIVQDADRLDALGAIGIARAFAYGGNHNRLIHNPDELPQLHGSFEEYKKNNSSTVNHFYEKLLLLKDRMNTTTGKQIAEKRHHFMQNFLTQFMGEWDYLA